MATSPSTRTPAPSGPLARPETGKRRLPVLQSSGASDDEPPRPSWQWVVFGALAIVTAWVPAAAIAGAFVAHWETAALSRAREGCLDCVEVMPLAAISAYAMALAAGAAAGGYMVGRWGSPGIGLREAALAGLAASTAAVIASWRMLGPNPGAVVVPLLVVTVAAACGRLGLRRRARAG